MTRLDTARRGLLRGYLNREAELPRMPWAVEDFTTTCERCDDCIRACEAAILVVGDGGFPTVDFQRGGCTFCAACVTVCRHGALVRGSAAPWSRRVAIGDDCLAARGITCRACGDACDVRAIRFQLQPGGRALPRVDESLCNGCGSCIATCPIQVIQSKEAT